MADAKPTAALADDLVGTLRRTTRHMANQSSCPMSLWQEHSVAVLQAADEIERLRQPVAGDVVEREKIIQILRDGTHDGEVDILWVGCMNSNYKLPQKTANSIRNDLADAILKLIGGGK